MAKKISNSLFYSILISVVITWIVYRYLSTHRSQPEFTEVTCILPDGSHLPIDQDSIYMSDLYGKIPAKMLDTTLDSNATARIIVPPACRFKLMLNFYSAVFLNERTTFYIPIKVDPYHVMAVEGEAFFALKEEDTSAFYRIAAGPYAGIACGQGKMYIKTSEDSCTIAMITAHGMIKALGTEFPHIGPMQGVNMSKRVDPRKWQCGTIDSTYTPAFVIEVMRFNQEPFGAVAHFLEEYYHVEVIVENEYLSFQPVTFNIQPRKFSLEGVCEIIKNATGYEYEITKGKVTFFLKRLM